MAPRDEIIPAAELGARLEALPGWRAGGPFGDGISRTYAIAYDDAIRAVAEIGQAVIELEHRPDIDIRWDKLTVCLTTHTAGDVVTELDFMTAARVDEIASRHGAALESCSRVRARPPIPRSLGKRRGIAHSGAPRRSAQARLNPDTGLTTVEAARNHVGCLQRVRQPVETGECRGTAQGARGRPVWGFRPPLKIVQRGSPSTCPRARNDSGRLADRPRSAAALLPLIQLASR